MAQTKPAHIVMRRPHLRALPEPAALPAGYELRAFAGDDDLEPLAAALASAFEYPWTADLVRAKLTEAPDVKAVYLVTWQGRPVATASSRWLPERFPDSGYIHWVGTHRDHARRGLSAALLLRLLLDFSQRGYRDAVLETDDFRLAAIRLYLRFGFIPVYQVKTEDHSDRWSNIFSLIID